MVRLKSSLRSFMRRMLAPKAWLALARPAPAPRAKAASAAPRAGGAPDGMARKRFSFEGTRYSYLLFSPPARTGDALPLVLMLHGCKQTAREFAAATGMNEAAARIGFHVAYAEQSERANRLRCWNWFERRHQAGKGESAMLAALAPDAARKARADHARIHVVGLSAGAVMALTVASSHPEIFAAVAAHSGAPEGSAGDVFAALRVMRDGPGRGLAGWAPRATGRPFVPLFVVHGASDRSVHPGNSDAIFEAAVKAAGAAGIATARRESRMEGEGRRASLRMELLDDAGTVMAEAWSVEGLAHAWSGGVRGASFTDARGPDATTAIAAFLMRHRLPPPAAARAAPRKAAPARRAA